MQVLRSDTQKIVSISFFETNKIANTFVVVLIRVASKSFELSTLFPCYGGARIVDGVTVGNIISWQHYILSVTPCQKRPVQNQMELHWGARLFI